MRLTKGNVQPSSRVGTNMTRKHIRSWSAIIMAQSASLGWMTSAARSGMTRKKWISANA